MLATLVASSAKKYIAEGDLFRILFVFALAFVAAALWTFKANTEIGQTFVAILSASGAFWAFLWKYVEEAFKAE